MRDQRLAYQDDSAALPVRGGWDSISIIQSGDNNVLKGAFEATAGSTTSSLSASYGGGNNVHTLSIGQTTAPVNPQVSISVTNTDPANTANTISDTLDGSALSYSITGNSNTVSNSVSNATSFSQTLSVVGSGNSVTNTSDGSGDKTINVSLASDGNSVSNAFTGGTGTQVSDLTANSGSVLDFALVASGNNTSATLSLDNVVAGGAGILINQASAGATANVTTTALANGYTVYVSHQ